MVECDNPMIYNKYNVSRCWEKNNKSAKGNHKSVLLSFCLLTIVHKFKVDGWMDGWMTGNFTSFSTVFQSYQDDGRVLMKGCVQWVPTYD